MGIQNVFEDVTITTIKETEDLDGSAGNLVTAVYEKYGKRAILDGGFTRLCISWDSEGTARYVKNAALLPEYSSISDQPFNGF